jgi:tRNA-specific 2-thiouridylase
VRDRNKDGFLRRELNVDDDPGPITDADGRVLGTHPGLLGYTIGQREGIGLALGKPVYVVAMDRANNRLVVGDKESLLRSDFTVDRVNWVSIAPPPKAVRATVKIRSRAEPAEATIIPQGADRARVCFDVPQPAVSPGQAAVFYDDYTVLGGGWIAADA